MSDSFNNQFFLLPQSRKLILGFVLGLIIRAMKLDFVEIDRLSLPGLWDVAALTALISNLLAVIKAGMAKPKMDFNAGLKQARMLARQYKLLREQSIENLSMRIKAWVMLCPARIAQVRGIIGEAAIKKWLHDYGKTGFERSGVSQGSFLDGAQNARQSAKQGPRREFIFKFTRPSHAHETRAYTWKLFALDKSLMVKPLDVKFLSTHDFLFKNDILHGVNMDPWPQLSRARFIKPVLFTPYELEPEIAPKQGVQTSPCEVPIKDRPKPIRGDIHAAPNLDLTIDDLPPDEKPP